MNAKRAMLLFLSAIILLFSNPFAGNVARAAEDPVAVTGISLNQRDDIVAKAGDSFTIAPTVLPADAADRSVTWTTSDPTVATVANGVVTVAGNSGTAVITATTVDGGFSDSVSICACNLLGDGSFEKWSAGKPVFPWGAQNRNGSPVVSSDLTDYITGSGSIKIEANVGDRAQVYQYVNDIEVGKSYKFSAWIKTRGVSSSQGARIQVYFLDGAGATMMSTLVDVGKLKGDNEWTYKEVIMTAPEGAAKLGVFNLPDVQTGTAAGTTWFDAEAVVPWTAVTGISLDQSEASLNVGETLALHATVAPADALNQRVIWTTSDAAVATVSDEGVVQATGNGTATITATTEDGGKAAVCTVNVGGSAEVTGISLNQRDDIIAKAGDSITISPTVLPADAADRSVTWTTSDPTVATVANGVVTVAGNSGTAVITATTVDGGFSDSVSICACNLLGNGSFEQANAASPPTPALPWGTQSKDGSPVVSMDTTDYITGGESVKIEANVGSRAQIYQYVDNIEVGQSYKFSVWIKTQGVSSSQGARVQLYFLEENGTPMATDHPTNTLVDVGKLKGDNEWTYREVIMTAPEGAAKLGVFNLPDVQTGTAAGTTWFDAEAVVPWTAVTGISLDQSEASLGVGETLALHATVVPADATDQHVIWTTSDAAVATVSEDGTITGHKRGIVNITARTLEGSFISTAIVQVGESSTITTSDYNVTTGHAAAVSGTVTATAPGDDSLSYFALVQPVNGTVLVNSDGTWTYTPDAAFDGTDSFKIAVVDQDGGSAFSTITVTVKSLADNLNAYSNVHPRLLLDSDRVTQLRTAILPGGTHEALWTQFKARLAPILLKSPLAYYKEADLSENWQIPGAGNAVNFALAYLLEPDAAQKEAYLEAATKWALKAVSYPTWGRCADSVSDCVDKNTDLSAGEQLSAISLVYDWLYDSLSVTDRNTIEQVLYDRANEMYLKDSGQAFNGQKYNVYWPSMYLFNHMYLSISGLATAGLALFDSHPDAASWLSFAQGIFDKTNQYLQPDGASQEGTGYWQAGTDYLLRYAMLSKKFLGVDMFTNPYFKNNIKFAIYLTLPENSWKPSLLTVNIGDSAGASADGYDYLLRLLASETNDGYAQWLANRMDEANVMSYDHPNGLKYDFLNLLWYDPSVAETPTSDLPTLHHFDDLDIVSARSDWSGDESLVVFKSGPPMGHHVNEVKDVYNDWGAGHIHPDANHFSVFGEGEWLVRDDGYADKRTSNHNTLLVEDEGQLKGQLGEGQRWFDIVSAESVKMNPQMTKVESHADFDFMIGDATDAYPDSLGLTKYKRYLIYIKPDILIVADDIATDASQAAKKLELRFHPEFTNPVQLPDGSYYTVGSNSILRFEELTPGASVTTSAEPVPYKSDLFSGDRLAYRVIHNTEKTWKNAAAFTWAEQGYVPADVKLTQDGDVWTFEADGKAVSLDFSQDTAVAVTPSDSENITNDATLDAIYVDGKPLDGFLSSETLYILRKSSKTAESMIVPIQHDSGAMMTVTKAAGPMGTDITDIRIVSEDGTVTRQYRIVVAATSLLPITSAESNGTTGFNPNDAVDGNMVTYWSAKPDDSLKTTDNPDGYPWLKFDLGGVISLSKVDIAWYEGIGRKFMFDLQYSLDGTTWSNIACTTNPCESSGTTSGQFETYDFPDIQTRYFRILGHGNTKSIFFSVDEVSFYRPDDAAPPAWDAGSLAASQYTADGLTLTWSGASDDVGVLFYKILQDGATIDTILGDTNSYHIGGLTNGQSYVFKIEAGDAAENWSTSGPSLNLEFEGEKEPSVQNSELSLSAVNFDKKSSAQADVVTTMTLNGNTFVSIKNGAAVLEAGKDYEFSGSTVTIKKNYLAALPKGTANLLFTFSAGAAQTLAITVVDTTPTPTDGNTDTSQTTNSGTDDNASDGSVGKETTKTVNGRKVTKVTLDQKKLEEKLAVAGSGAVIAVPVHAASDIAIGELTGLGLQSMEKNQAVLQIQSERATYTIPAQQINIGLIAKKLGNPADLQDIQVQIEIAEPDADTVKVVESAANQGQFEIVVPPLNFTVRASYGDSTIEVGTFSAYVERMMAIPDGVEPSSITTAVVVNQDGTVRQVPTKIVNIDGKYFAQVNSLTNSTYSVISNHVQFQDVAGHWAKNAVNDMGSRMIVSGIGNGSFNPDQDITRAEFAAIVVRGLGLELMNGAAPFNDVKASDWYNSAVQTAYSYQLISGFEDGSFRPLEKITREQAMTVIAKAMAITDLKSKLSTKTAEELLRSFADAAQVSRWAKNGIADCLQAGIVSGRSETALAPKAFITRAEAAVIVQKLLQQSGLI